MLQVFAVNFGDGQAVTPKMAGEFDEGHVLFAHVVKNPNGAGWPIRRNTRQADDLAARAAQLALQGLHAFGGNVESLFEQGLEDIHGNGVDEIKISLGR